MKRLVRLAAGMALAATTLRVPPASAGLPVSAAACGNNRYFTSTLRVDRARLKTHKQDRPLVEVILKNPCAGYAITGGGYLPVDSDNRRVMLAVAPGVNVDLKAADLDRFHIPRNFQWQGGGGAGGTLAALTCRQPTHLITKDGHGKTELVPYHPDTSHCPK